MLKQKRLECDVLVVGSGTAGARAAIAAAQEGMRVIAVDQLTYPGGLTRQVAPYYYGVDTSPEIHRIDDMNKDYGVGLGAGWHPEPSRCALWEEFMEYGITFVCGQPFEVLKEREEDVVRGVLVQTERETVTIFCRVLVDGTGDADVAVLAGAPYRVGREWDQLPHAHAAQARCFQSGRVTYMSNEDWCDIRDLQDISRAWIEGRKRLWDRLQPDPDTQLVSFAAQLGWRGNRYIEGEYTLTLEDLVKERTFPDAITVGYSNYDTHAMDYANLSDFAQIWCCVLGLWALPVGCQIPYRCLVPREIDGVLVASRAISLTSDAAMALRMIRDLRVIGEVAGVAASIAVKTGLPPRYIDIQQLQGILARRGITYDKRPIELMTGRGMKRWPVKGVSSGKEGEVLLDSLGIDREPESMFWWQNAPDDLSWLGTRAEGKSLLYVYRTGDRCKEELQRILRTATGLRKRGAAFALGLLGDQAAVEELIACVQRRDDDVLSGRRTHPRWIGAMVLLRLLKAPQAFGAMLDVLAHGAKSSADRDLLKPLPFSRAGATFHEAPWMSIATLDTNARLFALRYFDDCLKLFTTEEKRQLQEELKRLLSRKLGDDIRMFDGQRNSLRWSLETTAAGLLLRLGEPYARLGQEVLQMYMQDRRRFARNAAYARWKEAVQ